MPLPPLLRSSSIQAAIAASQAGITLAQDASPEADGPLWYEDTQGPPQPGGTVRFLLYEDPNTLNPILGWTTIAIQVINAISEGLTENAPDGGFAVLIEIPIERRDSVVPQADERAAITAPAG